MTTGRPFHGRLFAEDFLGESITKFNYWRDVPDAELDDLEAALRGVFDRFPTDRSPKTKRGEGEEQAVQETMSRTLTHATSLGRMARRASALSRAATSSS